MSVRGEWNALERHITKRIKDTKSPCAFYFLYKYYLCSNLLFWYINFNFAGKNKPKDRLETNCIHFSLHEYIVSSAEKTAFIKTHLIYWLDVKMLRKFIISGINPFARIIRIADHRIGEWEEKLYFLGGKLLNKLHFIKGGTSEIFQHVFYDDSVVVKQ